MTTGVSLQVLGKESSMKKGKGFKPFSLTLPRGDESTPINARLLSAARNPRTKFARFAELYRFALRDSQFTAKGEVDRIVQGRWGGGALKHLNSQKK